MKAVFTLVYGGIRSGYQHFSAQGGQDSGFPSPRGALGYPFPPMHQNSYSGYHLGSYAPPCASPPKDGKCSLYRMPRAASHRRWKDRKDNVTWSFGQRLHKAMCVFFFTKKY
uniref:Uncharacterized protein n=1 Tax=Anopheles melas TaxID=34690 RepID=A0A182UK18_9DIPT